MRERYKTALLSIQYVLWPATLASLLGISTEMIAQHHELFGVYWGWAADWTVHALDTGAMCTLFDWRRTGITELNERTITNIPVQATAGDALRITCIWATRHGLQLLAPVHDAIGHRVPIERIDPRPRVA